MKLNYSILLKIVFVTTLIIQPFSAHAGEGSYSDSHENKAGLPDAANLNQVKDILARYSSLPKGLTVEGIARGLPPLTGPRYDRRAKKIIFAGREEYPLTIKSTELLDIITALEADDKLGVSLALSGAIITYGQLSPKSSVAKGLLAGDKLICGVAFARSKWIRSTPLPGGYKPVAVRGRRRIMSIIHTNLDEFGFRIVESRKKKLIVCTGFRTTYLIIPISRTRAKDGGYLPDLERVAKNEIEKADQENLAHLNQTRDDYFKIPALERTAKFGEAASIIRYLQKRGVSLKDLIKDLH